jgi:hypothetical protein
MALFWKKRNREDNQTENLKLMAEMFAKCHNNITESLNKHLAEASIVGERNSLKVEKASKLEIGLYLLFRLDQRMCTKQTANARQSLFKSCLDSMLPSSEDRFFGLACHRIATYGEIFNRVKASGGDWGEYTLQCND